MKEKIVVILQYVIILHYKQMLKLLVRLTSARNKQEEFIKTRNST